MARSDDKLHVPILRFKNSDGKNYPDLIRTTIGELGTFLGGGTPSTNNKDFWLGSTPWISSSDIKEDSIHKISITRFISNQAIIKSATKRIPKKSILLISRVGVGKLVVSTQEVCTSQDFSNFTPNTDNAYFLAYYLISHKNKLLALSQGTSIKGFTIKDIRLLKVLLPNEQEQQKIATFLTAIDTKIQQLKQKHSLLQQYKKGVMQQLFSQQLRFKDEQGEDYPDWKIQKISDIGYFYYGKGAPKSSIREGARTPCVRYGELYSTYDEVIKEVVSYTEIEPKKLKFSKGGEVLVPRVGEDPLDFANCSYLPLKNVAIGEMISVFNPTIDALYCTYYFNTLKKQFAKLVEGGSVANLYFRYLESIIISVPTSIKEQQKIANFLSSIDDKINHTQQQIQHTERFKKGLLQKIFV